MRKREGIIKKVLITAVVAVTVGYMSVNILIMKKMEKMEKKIGVLERKLESLEVEAVAGKGRETELKQASEEIKEISKRIEGVLSRNEIKKKKGFLEVESVEFKK